MTNNTKIMKADYFISESALVNVELLATEHHTEEPQKTKSDEGVHGDSAYYLG